MTAKFHPSCCQVCGLLILPEQNVIEVRVNTGTVGFPKTDRMFPTAPGYQHSDPTECAAWMK